MKEENKPEWIYGNNVIPFFVPGAVLNRHDKRYCRCIGCKQYRNAKVASKMREGKMKRQNKDWEKIWHRFIYDYAKATIISSSAFERDSLAFISQFLKVQREELKKKVEGMRKKIDKRRTTDERRYPYGYNQTVDDFLNLLKE